jgi:hypothetical protein
VKTTRNSFGLASRQVPFDHFKHAARLLGPERFCTRIILMLPVLPCLRINAQAPVVSLMGTYPTGHIIGHGPEQISFHAGNFTGQARPDQGQEQFLEEIVRICLVSRVTLQKYPDLLAVFPKHLRGQFYAILSA